MESSCHTGLECVYDSVTDLGWRVSLSNHRIRPVINDLLVRYNKTAECVPVNECVDCFEWDWVA
jgi:lipase ATG15